MIKRRNRFNALNRRVNERRLERPVSRKKVFRSEFLEERNKRLDYHTRNNNLNEKKFNIYEIESDLNHLVGVTFKMYRDEVEVYYEGEYVNLFRFNDYFSEEELIEDVEMELNDMR